jgi:hypothetical protein
VDSTPTDSSFEYDVESERKLSAKNKKMGLFGIGLYSKDQSRWSRKDRVFLVIPWSSSTQEFTRCAVMNILER